MPTFVEKIAMFSPFKSKKDKAAQLREKIFFILLSDNKRMHEPTFLMREVETYIKYLMNN